jgi:GGDEF domain-containing protein
MARLLLHYAPDGRDAPDSMQVLVADEGLEILQLTTADEVLACVSRAYPVGVVAHAGGEREVFETCRTLKRDPFTAVVPLIAYTDGEGQEVIAEALEAGVDEVLSPALPERELALRLRMALRRAERDVSVHPTTRLPGTVQIERDIAERLRSGERFAVCYADLDHFKEFNDRYGYNHGDRVILIVSRILRDLVRAHSEEGFVGHIGGDDFIFTLPLEQMHETCALVVEVFDELIPYQYEEEDRARGFFHGKDRRGDVFEVPLMTLSIGVVTNQRRTFSHPAQISELATEMKSYAKTFEGSLYLVDRRRN